MKKFLVKLTIFVLIVVSIVHLISIAYINMDVSDNYDTEKFASMPVYIQICNFGSSHGRYGFNYEDVDSKYECFNFGLTSQWLSYDYRLMTYYQDHIQKGTIVFIPISFFSFFGKKETEALEFLVKNKRYYTILPKELIKVYDFSTDIIVNYLPVLTVSPMVVVTTLAGGGSRSVHEAIWHNKASDIDISQDAKAACERHITKEFVDGHRTVNQEEITALYGMIDLCRSKGAIPILITTPFLAEYISEVKTDVDFYDDFYAVLQEVIERTGVDYFDYSFDERFIGHYDWFMNSDHLNKEGAKIFVDILMEEIVFEKR